MPPKKEKRLLYQPKDMVLAKMTGFPAWPSFVMPPESIPASIMRAKKKTTNTCVIFIPDGDFNWMNEKSLEALSPEKLQAKLDKVPKDKLKTKPKKKSTRTTNVVDAFIAASGLQFDDFMAELSTQKDSFDDDEDDEEEEEEENDDQAVEDEASPVDNPAIEDPEPNAEPQEEAPEEPVKEEVAAPVTKSRPAKKESVRGKRRSPRSIPEDDADAESVENDTNGTRKTVGSDEPTTTDGENDDDKSPNAKEDEEAEDESTQKEEPTKKPAATRKRTRGTRSEAASQEPDGTIDGKAKEENDAETEEPPLKKSAREARASSPKLTGDKDRQHQLWLCRIKLQRSLIQRNQPVTPKDPSIFPPPTVDELSMARIILQKLAEFPVTVDLLRDTKIHKVLKCIVKDVDLEYPDSFRLHEKCKELLEKWQSVIDELKSGKLGRPESRIGSTAPEDSEISGIEIKPTLDKEYAGKVGV